MWITFGLPWGWIHDQSVKKVTAVPGYDEALPKLPRLPLLPAGDREDDEQSLWPAKNIVAVPNGYKTT